MTGNLVRGVVGVLAALTVAASGTAVSAAQTGSSSGTPCSLVGGCGVTGLFWHGFAGDVLVRYHGPAYVVPGQDVTFIGELARSYQDAGATPGVTVTSVTHLAPEGFEFTGATVTSYEETPGAYPVKVLGYSTSSDVETREVTVTSPGGGWTLPTWEATVNGQPQQVAGSVFVEFHYRVTKAVEVDSLSAITAVTGPDVPASEEWLVRGLTNPGTGGIRDLGFFTS
jgi:hypothetical protein